jgi:hypothetical protein
VLNKCRLMQTQQLALPALLLSAANTRNQAQTPSLLPIQTPNHQPVRQKVYHTEKQLKEKPRVATSAYSLLDFFFFFFGFSSLAGVSTSGSRWRFELLALTGVSAASSSAS